jgi:hypothetical protein
MKRKQPSEVQNRRGRLVREKNDAILEEVADRDSGIDRSDSEESDESEESCEEEENLPLMFFMFAREQLQNGKESSGILYHIPSPGICECSLKALEKCKLLLLEDNNNGDLSSILQKSKKRIVTSKQIYQIEAVQFNLDNKVPPGSSEVIRSVTNTRFLLSCACIEMHKILILLGDYHKAYEQLRESLIWFPRHIEVRWKYFNYVDEF